MSNSCTHKKWLSRVGMLFIVVMVLASVFLVVVQSKIVTYTCGNDPMLYARAARVFLSPSLYGPESVQYYLKFAAPGYPAILAVAIKCFGSLSPFWVNCVFLLLSLPLMWSVFRRLMGSDRAAAFALLCLLLIAFSGDKLNAPFLLYPFREAARLLFVYLAYFCLVKGASDKKIVVPWLLGSSVSMLAAVSVREPSVLIFPCLILGGIFLMPTWKERMKVAGWIALPWIVAAILACMVVFGKKLADVSQFSVMQYLGNHHVALANGRKMLGWFPGEATWPGMILILIGIGRAFRKERALLALFLLPAALFFIFYSYMQVHIRYFLTSLMFLAVFAGYGLDALCGAVDKLLKGSRARYQPLVTWGVTALLTLGLMHTAHTREVWGPKVKAADVREWQELVKGLEPSADGRVRVVVEQRCRYLEGILYSYTDADLLDAKNIDNWPAQWAPAHYFKPMNKEAHYATPQWLMWLKIYAHRIMEHELDVLPVSSGGEPLMIGKGEYSQYVVKARTGGAHEQRIEVVPGEDNIVWLDWGACDVDLARTVTVRNAETGKTWYSGVLSGSGLQAIRIASGDIDGVAATLQAKADGALPSLPVIDVTLSSKQKTFRDGVDRLMSLNRVFVGIDENSTEEGLRYLSLGAVQGLVIPELYGADGGHWRVTLFGRIEGASNLYLRSFYGGEGVVRDLDMSSGQSIFCAEEGKPISLRLESSVVPEHGAWTIEGVSFQYCTDSSIRGE